MPRRDPWVYIGLFAFFALLFVALFGERIAPHESIYFVLEHGDDPRPYDPGVVFPLGSDVLGRDLFSVVLAGARATLIIVVIGGVARVLAGVALALVGAWSRRLGVGVNALASLVSAVPATLVALLIVKVFVKLDTSLVVFVLALLVTGWAGPYRVLRAELDRLAAQAFTESASALGVRRWNIVTRHHLPHLVPLMAMNASQQIVASLVLLAELGVLGIFVGSTRAINVAESLTKVRTGIVNEVQVSELSEWGGLLANASTRTMESLWVTRWLFLIPGLAFAITAVAVSTIGFALARRYARRNLAYDLRGRGLAMLAATCAVLVLLSAIAPERYAAAVGWGNDARAALASTTDTRRAFTEARLQPISSDFAVERDTVKVVKTGSTTVRIGDVTLDDRVEPATGLRPLLDADTGGDLVDAPLVFVSRGVSPEDYQPRRTSFFSAPDLGSTIAGYVDDYAGVDVRGKVVVLMRFYGVTLGDRIVSGPDVGTAIDNALKRGAAAVLFVDPDLPRYVNVVPSSGGSFVQVSPYRRLEDDFRITDTPGPPVVILGLDAANRVLAPAGLRLGTQSGWLPWDSPETKVSQSRDLGMRARVEVPLQEQSAHITSFVGETPGLDAAVPRIVVWCVRRDGAAHPTVDVCATLARELATKSVPFVFVDFDPTIDPTANARAVADVLRARTIKLIAVVDGLDGSALRFTTPFGDLIPAIDLYADRAGARHVVTRTTARIETWVWPGSGAYPDTRAVLMSGTGGAGDLREDAAALLGYLAGRYALGAEELRP